MCRPFRLSRALSVQHAGFRAGSRGCHLSSLSLLDRSRSIVVANVRSPAPAQDHLLHSSKPVPLSPFQLSSFHRQSARPFLNLVTSRRAYSQSTVRHLDSSLIAEDVPMVTDTLDIDAKPADILNGDVTLPAGRAEGSLDPESDQEVPVDADELKDALGRPPPVHSDYLPLPWKGRLGYVSSRAQPSSGRHLVYVLTWLGLFEHLPALLHPIRLLLANMPHCVDSRK